jgi:hypothetical protein
MMALLHVLTSCSFGAAMSLSQPDKCCRSWKLYSLEPLLGQNGSWPGRLDIAAQYLKASVDGRVADRSITASATLLQRILAAATGQRILSGMIQP